MKRKLEFNAPWWLIVLLTTAKKPLVYLTIGSQLANAISPWNVDPSWLLIFTLARESVSEFLKIWAKQEIEDDSE